MSYFTFNYRLPIPTPKEDEKGFIPYLDIKSLESLEDGISAPREEIPSAFLTSIMFARNKYYDIKSKIEEACDGLEIDEFRWPGDLPNSLVKNDFNTLDGLFDISKRGFIGMMCIPKGGYPFFFTIYKEGNKYKVYIPIRGNLINPTNRKVISEKNCEFYTNLLLDSGTKASIFINNIDAMSMYSRLGRVGYDEIEILRELSLIFPSQNYLKLKFRFNI